MKRVRIRTRLAAWLAAMSLATMVVAVQPAIAASTSATLDQCANGAPGHPRAACLGAQWQNGNLNESNSQYREGDSVPFRAIITVGEAGAHKIWIQFDNTKQSKHAYDYLTSWNATESGNPTSGHTPSDTSTTTSLAIPTPANAFCAAGAFKTPPAIVAGSFKLYGGTLDAVSIKNPDGSSGVPASCTGDNSVSYEIDFTTTASQSDLVLAWGGHIGSELNWGVGHSAVDISGSPYHQRILQVDTVTIGNQDRSLKASAVLVPPTIVTQVSPGGSNPTVAVGDSVTDQVTVSGSVGTPAGSVQFSLCTGICPADGVGATPLGGAIALSGGQATSPAVNTGASPLAAGQYCFFVSYTPASGSQYTSGTETNVTTECFTVAAAHITITKVADAASVSAGDPIGFTITVTNTGAGSASGVAVTDTLPVASGVSWVVDGTKTTGTWAINAGVLSLVSPTTLAAGAAVTVHVTSSTTKDSCGKLDNTASFSSTNDGSGDASASVTVNCAAIAITKVADADAVSAGDPIGFTITVTNTGAGTAKGVTVTDTLPTTAGLSWSIDGTKTTGTWAINAGVLGFGPADLAAGASVKVHIVSPTSAATCGGSVDNTASVTTTNDGSAQASDSVSIECAVIEITKVADAGSVSAGDQVGFTIVVKNNGLGAAQGVTVTDSLPTDPGLAWSIDSVNSSAGWSIASGVLHYGPAALAAGASVKVHIVSPTSAATCGTVDNTASVTTTNDGSGSAGDSVVVNCASIAISKVADAASVSAGDQVGFTIVVKNNGSGTAKGVTVTDSLPTNAGLSWSIDTGNSDGGWSIGAGVLHYGPATLAAGAQVKVHIVSPTTAATAPCPSGRIDNTAAVTTTNDGSAQASDSIVVDCAQIAITKVADADSVSAGDQLGFTIVVKNNGTGTAQGVTVADTLPTNAGLAWSIDGAHTTGTWAINAGVLRFGPAPLAAGASVKVHIVSATSAATCGTVDNTASVTTTNDGADAASDSVVVNCAEIHIVKTADADSVNAGQAIGFTIVVSNAGLGSAYGVAVTDTLPTNPGLAWSIDLANSDAGWSIGSGVLHFGPATLAAGASVKVHIVSPTTMATAPCPGGTVLNTASVTTTNDGSGAAGDSISVLCLKLGLTKTDNLNPLKYDHVGQVVTYTITATNTGTGTLHNVTVSDDPALDGFSCDPAIPVASLAVGAEIVCTGTHTITQADLDRGSFEDTASASSNEVKAPDADDTIYGQQSPGLGLSKTDNLNPQKYDHVGLVVKYTITATNTGNVTLHNVTVSDDPALDAFSCIPAIPVASLAPGAQVVCTGYHTITQADLDAGSFEDTASASSTETKAPDADDTILGLQMPVLGLEKTDNLNPDKYDHVGQVVTYTITATNLGNITLHNVTVSDDPALDGFSCDPAIPVASLAVGAEIVCTGTHSITQADLDAGWFKDVASASSTETKAPDADDTVLADKDAVLGLTKTDDLNPQKYDHVGQVVTYTITATNLGNITLHNVTVSDDPALDAFSCIPAIPVASLAVGAKIVCTGTHTITQADLDAGSFMDVASASSDETKAPDADDTILGAASATIGITKTDNLNPDPYKTVGQVVTYTITATNTGNVTLHNVTVTDDPVLDGFTCDPAIPVAALAPGDKIVCTGTHTITQADLDANKFPDTATATSDEASASATDTIFREEIHGATGTPHHTAPPTSTTTGTPGEGGTPSGLLLLLIVGTLGMIVISTQRRTVRR